MTHPRGCVTYRTRKEDEAKSLRLLDGVQFSDRDARAEPLYVDRHGRAIRFSLEGGQSIKEHNAPSSPFYVVVLKGRGLFAGSDGKEGPFGPNALLIFDPKENH